MKGKHKRPFYMTLYAILFFAGLALLSIAIRQYQQTIRLLADGVKTDATVIQLITNYDSDGNTYTPVFQYKNRSGETKTFSSPISSSPAPYAVGELVKIVYDPNDEKLVKTVTYWGLYRWAIILAIFASPLLIIGGGYLLYVKG